MRKYHAAKARSSSCLEMLSSPLTPGSHTLRLDHQGRARRYVVHIPKTGQPPYPVVLAFHGAGGTARIMLHHSRWSTHADHSGFVVVAPEGTPPNLNEKPSFRFNPQLWNLGGASISSLTGHADDVGFVSAILDALPLHCAIDVHRIYSTGFSNGAGLTFRLAIELGDRLAAIGPVAGLPSNQGKKPSRPIPMLYFIGSLDPLVPWHGGEVTSPWSGKSSVRPAVLQSLQVWAKDSGFAPDLSVLQKNDAIEEVMLGKAAGGSEARYAMLAGLGHHWPGGKDVGVPVEILGPRIKTIDATEKLWQFFQLFRS